MADPKLPGTLSSPLRGHSLILTTQLSVSMSRLVRLDLHANSFGHVTDILCTSEVRVMFDAPQRARTPNVKGQKCNGARPIVKSPPLQAARGFADPCTLAHQKPFKKDTPTAAAMGVCSCAICRCRTNRCPKTDRSVPTSCSGSRVYTAGIAPTAAAYSSSHVQSE
jgi:hypothetical protein